MAGVAGEISIRASLSLAGAAVGGGASGHSMIMENLVQFEPGNAALGLADVLYHAERTLAASATENLDLTGLLLDPLGGTVTQAEVMAIVIKAKAANTNNVHVGPAAATSFLGPWNAAADRNKIEPGQVLVLTSVKGWLVGAGTSDLITVLNGAAGTPVTYEIAIVGRTIVG